MSLTHESNGRNFNEHKPSSMKKQVSLVLILLLVAVWSPAQDQQQDRDQTRLQEHLMFQDGKMYQIRNQERIQ